MSRATQQILTPQTILITAIVIAIFWLLLLPVSPAQAALAVFLITAAIWLKLISRRQLDNLTVERLHLPRVFQDDPVTVQLRLHRGAGLPIDLLELEDLFLASLDPTQRKLIPLLAEGWILQLTYDRRAERHRGLYLLGPVRVAAADPLGFFPDRRELDCVTRLTVYPHADPLPDYQIPGPLPPPGVSLHETRQIGQGEEILAVREYTRGDPPSRIHWRTSARRGRLHVIQRTRPIQAELCVLIDLTRLARFGLGADATSELAIHAAVSVLRRAHETRHRLSLSYAHREPVHFPPGQGLAHTQQLLDRLAIVHPEGETDFWAMAAERTQQLPAGSRAVLIGVSSRTPLDRAVPLIEQLINAHIAVDVVLIDDRTFIRIYHEQEMDSRKYPTHEDRAAMLRLTGARVYALQKGETGLQLGESSAAV